MRPHVLLYAQLSIDGKISTAHGASSKGFGDLEGVAIQSFRHEKRASVDAIMVGSRTVWSDNPSLTVRFSSGANPLRVIPVGTGQLPSDATILNDGNPTLVVVSEMADPKSVAFLKTCSGVEVLVCGRERVDFSSLFGELGRRGIRSLMVEGGGILVAHLLSCGLIDEMFMQHIPVVLGGSDAPTIVAGPGVRDFSEGISVHLLNVGNIDGHIVARYAVEHSIRL